MNFKVLHEDIIFSNEFIKLNELRKEFLNMALNSFDVLKEEFFKEITTREDLLEYGKVFGTTFIETYILRAVQVISEYGVDNIDMDSFREMYLTSEYYQWENAVNDIIQENYTELQEQIKNKDVIEEGTENFKVNLYSELLKNEFQEKLIKLLESSDVVRNEFYRNTLSRLFNSMCESIVNVHYKVIEVLKDNNVTEIMNYYELESLGNNKLIMDNLLCEDKIEEKNINTIKEIIKVNPYNEEIYKLLVNKYGDKNSEIEQLSSFVGYDNINGYKCRLLSEYFMTLSLNSKDEAILAKEGLIEFANKLNINNYLNYVSEIDEIIEGYNNEAAITEDEVKVNKRVNREAKKKSKIPVIILSCLLGLIAVYFIMVVYFNTHFFIGTSINGIGVSGKGVKGANDYMAAQASNYTLELVQRGNVTEEILGSQINLKYDFYNQIDKLIEDQNPFLWVTSLFAKNEYTIKDDSCVSYDEILFKQVVGGLDCFDNTNITSPSNAYVEYADGKYDIVSEELGNEVDMDKLFEEIKQAVTYIETSIDFNKKECYVSPMHTSESKEVIAAKDTANSYIKAKVTYNIGDSQEVVNGDLISSWINIDDELNVVFDEAAVSAYIDELGSKYDYLGDYKELTRVTGEIIKVSTTPGIYYVDRVTEKEALIEAIQTGKEVTKDLTLVTPIDSDTYVVNTFVEVDLTNQYVTFYKNGQLLTQGGCVTGSVAGGYATPAGVFRLDWKKRDTVLRGEGYASPVTFWMPFNGGIGLHDASWRSNFGGQIYQTNGSHGCVNLPYSVAEVIFNNLGESAVIIVKN